MSAMLPGFPRPGLDEPIAEVERELALRRRLYPLQVEKKRLSQSKADWQIDVMEAVLESLLVLKRSGP